MAENKTKPTDLVVEDFIDSIEEETKRDDCRELISIMSELTRSEPVMWGNSIVGFGQYHYKYASGREGDFMLLGFSPRKTSLTLYFMDGFDKYAKLLSELGKYKTGKSCLYIKKLDDINRDKLREMIILSVSHLKNNQ